MANKKTRKEAAGEELAHEKESSIVKINKCTKQFEKFNFFTLLYTCDNLNTENVLNHSTCSNNEQSAT